MDHSESTDRLQSGRVKDCRGRSVVHLDPIALRLHGGLETMPPDLLNKICGEIGTRMTTTELWLFGSPRVMHWVIRLAVVIFGLLTILLIAAGLLRRIPPARLAPQIALLGASLGCLYLLWIVARRLRSRRVVEIMLEHRRCPHCGYDLQMLPESPEDGATVCPECGCAWRIEDETSKTRCRHG